ncbi:NYN domain-containing protein [Sphingomonas sp. SUN039]|uniref:LabA-like NYN domain-containing protein n=1 Tax=Sphingomonas sp. SUN039 TaxID=2937787 RepID=UPI002164A042|nr:NYN domain-containing protein [Sphingomonas sp. SUN039]UVO54813.1 NYN domain-containing protein [Sphingomonas sp. SUN039]
MPRLLIFVDEANFGRSARHAGFQPDLIALKNWLADPETGRNLIEMVVYIGLPPDWRPEDLPEGWRRAYDSKHRLRHALENNGIMTVAWRGKQLFNSNPPAFAANIDMLMAMDALELSLEAKPDIVVLVSGDGDFAYLANKLRRRGIHVEAASLPQAMSGELKRAVNEFIDLRDFFDEVGKPFIDYHDDDHRQDDDRPENGVDGEGDD